MSVEESGSPLIKGMSWRIPFSPFSHPKDYFVDRQTITREPIRKTTFSDNSYRKNLLQEIQDNEIEQPQLINHPKSEFVEL